MLRKARKYDLPFPLLFYPFIDYYTGDSNTCNYTHWCADNMSESDRIVQARKMLMGYCGGLVEATENKENYLCISFTHRSVPEFLDSLETDDMKKSLRGFCAEDAVSQFFLAYLCARYIRMRGLRFRTLRLAQFIDLQDTENAETREVGRAPFLFEEQLEFALVRVGVRSITEQGNSECIICDKGNMAPAVVATSYNGPAAKSYYICHPYLIAAYLGNFAYVLWKVTHDRSVTCTPLQGILLLYCILESGEDSTRVCRIFDILLEKGLEPETMSTLGPGLGGRIDYLEVIVWQHFIIQYLLPAAYIGMTTSTRRTFLKWALENKADPHFVVFVSTQMIPGPFYGVRGTAVILGKDKRRLDVPYKSDFTSLVTSLKYPDLEGDGIRMTLTDIIIEKKFEDRGELIALVERNTRLLQNEPEGTEDHTDKGFPEILPEEASSEQTSDSSTMLPASEMNIKSIAPKEASYEAKPSLILVYLLGILSALVVLNLVSFSRIFEHENH